MIVVSDTTPLNYLILIGSVEILPAIFGRVYAPSAVIVELLHARSPEAVRTWASRPPAWLAVQDPAHLDETLKLDPGETAAISLALELHADRVLIDERKGYKAVLQRGLKPASTLGVIAEAHYRGLIDFETTIERLERDTTFHISKEFLEEFKRQVRQKNPSQEGP
jgi:predicted nucleic acid-binding protein